MDEESERGVDAILHASGGESKGRLNFALSGFGHVFTFDDGAALYHFTRCEIKRSKRGLVHVYVKGGYVIE